MSRKESLVQSSEIVESTATPDGDPGIETLPTGANTDSSSAVVVDPLGEEAQSPETVTLFSMADAVAVGKTVAIVGFAILLVAIVVFVKASMWMVNLGRKAQVFVQENDGDLRFAIQDEAQKFSRTARRELAQIVALVPSLDSDGV